MKKAKEAPKKTGGVKKKDPEAPEGSGNVYMDFQAMLNQTNVGANNNKFYVVELHQNGGNYSLWTRWGRVGERGQSKLDAFGGNAQGAIAAFSKKFKDKSGNQWGAPFETKPGKYDLLQMDDADADSAEVAEALAETSEHAPCTLPKPTQELLKLIFDTDMFNAELKRMEIDVQKMPLGKLSAQQLLKGYETLEKLQGAIEGGKKAELASLTSRFYTEIPHSFGRNKPPLIDSLDLVQQKFDMLNTLSDIATATTAEAEAKKKAAAQQKKAPKNLAPHPLDVSFSTLDAKITPLDKSSAEYKLLSEYTANTGRSGWRQCTIEDIFVVDRNSEGKRFAQHDKISNRKLLWHGTNVAVVGAIIKSGLRIMPHSGGRVGRGIYSASENSKSASYVRCAPDGKTGIMFLNEVALGKEHHITVDDSSLKAPPKGFDSVVAQGRTEPNPKGDKSLVFDGKEVVVPAGKPTDRTEYKDSNFSQTEYLVYQESQVRMRYILKMKFN